MLKRQTRVKGDVSIITIFVKYMLEMCLFLMLKCDNHVKNELHHGKTNSVVSEQVRHKLSCTSTEDGQRLEILDLGSRDTVAKTKALIRFAVTVKLICVFVFAYAKCWFSHDAATYNVYCLDHVLLLCRKENIR